MGVYKFSDASSLATDKISYKSMLAGNTTWNPWQPSGSYDVLSTVTVPSGGLASITFAGISSEYKHLQLRMLIRGASTGGSMRLNFNDDGNGTNYSRHLLMGDGSTASASGSFNDSVTAAIGDVPTSSNASNIFGVFLVDILDYSFVGKNKTVRSLSGFDANGSGGVQLRSSGWYSTNAINSIRLYEGASTNLAQHSQISLYGVK
jgi:hypothetical protein